MHLWFKLNPSGGFKYLMRVTKFSFHNLYRQFIPQYNNKKIKDYLQVWFQFESTMNQWVVGICLLKSCSSTFFTKQPTPVIFSLYFLTLSLDILFFIISSSWGANSPFTVSDSPSLQTSRITQFFIVNTSSARCIFSDVPCALTHESVPKRDFMFASFTALGNSIPFRTHFYTNISAW